MDYFVIVVFALIFLMTLVVSLYFVAHNAHPNDTKFGSSFCIRFFIILSYALCLVPIALIPVDLYFEEELGVKDASLIWFIFLGVQAMWIWFFIPLFQFYYEG